MTSFLIFWFLVGFFESLSYLRFAYRDQGGRLHWPNFVTMLFVILVGPISTAIILVLWLETEEVKKPCKDCPFVAEQQGRPYLHPQRMEDIKFATALRMPFYCHKTVYAKGDPDSVYERHWQQCAGATEWAKDHAAETLAAHNIFFRDT